MGIKRTKKLKVRAGKICSRAGSVYLEPSEMPGFRRVVPEVIPFM